MTDELHGRRLGGALSNGLRGCSVTVEKVALFTGVGVEQLPGVALIQGQGFELGPSVASERSVARCGDEDDLG